MAVALSWRECRRSHVGSTRGAVTRPAIGYRFKANTVMGMKPPGSVGSESGRRYRMQAMKIRSDAGSATDMSQEASRGRSIFQERSALR
jgi:hypothetical protein